MRLLPNGATRPQKHARSGRVHPRPAKRRSRSMKLRSRRSLHFLDCWTNGIRRLGTMKRCSNCHRPAVFSLVAIISTLGISKRLQQSSPAILFCDACIQELFERICSDAFSDAVNNAYTTLNQRLRERIAASNAQQESISDHSASE